MTREYPVTLFLSLFRKEVVYGTYAVIKWTQICIRVAVEFNTGQQSDTAGVLLFQSADLFNLPLRSLAAHAIALDMRCDEGFGKA